MEHWIEAWESNHIGWHRDTVNKHLIDNLDALTNGKPNLKILIPFCGKTLDMIFLIEQGHNVIAVEAVTQAIEDFFQENNVSFNKEPITAIPNAGNVYSAFNGKLKIFECDYFSFKSSVVGEKVDGIWDCNALGAVCPDRRKEYLETSLDFLQPHGRILHQAFVYDTKERQKDQDAPYSVSLEELRVLFGDSFELQVLSKENAPDEKLVHFGLQSFLETLLVIIAYKT